MAGYEKDKFLVIPTKYLSRMSRTTRGQLKYILTQLEAIRRRDGNENTRPKYYVVNQDEPYSEQVLDIILAGEEKKEREV